MSKMIFTVGLPASGKTTWANKLVASDPEKFINVNRDDLRFMLFNDPNPGNLGELRVTSMQRSMIRSALAAGLNVIVSDTNLSRRTVEGLVKIGWNFGAAIEFEYFDVPVAECIKRNKLRQKVVPELVIEDIARRYVKKGRVPRYEFDSTEIVPRPYAHQDGLPWAIICDIDGTVAEGNRNMYDFDLCHTDSPKWDVITSVLQDYNAGYRIIFMSGRPDSHYDMTHAWLVEHLGISDFELHMRRADDGRRDSVIKEELFREHVDGKFNVRNAYDDRDQVVKLWRDKGITCYQVQYGDF